MPDDLRKPLSKSELRRLLPSTKDDLAAVQSLIDLGYPTVEPILYDLLKWIRQDSWPVARPLSAFLVKIGPALAPQVHASLRSRDSTLKAVVLKTIVNDWPKHEIVLLSPELHMLATDGQS